jgi:hypothetical protein
MVTDCADDWLISTTASISSAATAAAELLSISITGG